VEKGYDFPSDYYLIESVKINNISISLYLLFLVGIQVRWGKHIPKGLEQAAAGSSHRSAVRMKQVICVACSCSRSVTVSQY
jgi:hypothetical protein